MVRIWQGLQVRRILILTTRFIYPGWPVSNVYLWAKRSKINFRTNCDFLIWELIRTMLIGEDGLKKRSFFLLNSRCLRVEPSSRSMQRNLHLHKQARSYRCKLTIHALLTKKKKVDVGCWSTQPNDRGRASKRSSGSFQKNDDGAMSVVPAQFL